MNPIIKKQQVRDANNESTAPRRRRGHAKVANLLRVEGEVRAIEYQCSCGEVIVLELEYGELANEALSGDALTSAAEAGAPRPDAQEPGVETQEAA